MSGARAAVWASLAAATVLATRAIVYALAPQQLLAVELERRVGGPHLAAVLGISLAAVALAAAAVLWLAVVAVRERVALEARELVDAPCLRPALLARRLVAFFAATAVAFALLESTIHWREGLGWHGLCCLLGPVHRDAIPVLAALSVLVVAGHGAIEHLLAWARRLVCLLAARPQLLRRAPRNVARVSSPRTRRVLSPAAPRGPPVRAFA